MTFTTTQLVDLANAGAILASARLRINRRLQSLHPECHTAYLLRMERNAIDKALANYPDWREIDR